MATQDMGQHPLPALPPAQQQQQQHHHPLPSPPQQQQLYHPQQQQQQFQQQPQQYSQQQQQYPQQQLQQFYPRSQPQQQQHQQQQHAHFSQAPQQHPAHAQKPQTKPRSFSFRSDRSHGSNNRTDTHETSAEKEAKRLHSKADPTLAMNEAEPSLVQATVKSSLAPLRAIQHKDTFGNSISEPDRSNPTRSRWERPLDTIRSFEAAIDGGYSRKSFIRSDSDSVANFNRRSSYYGNNGPRFPQDSYYGGRPASAAYRPDSASQFEVRAPARESYIDPQNNANGYGYGMAGPSRQRASRMQSQPELNTYSRGEPSVYPLPHKDRSYETVTSAAGSGSSADPAGYQTDPTSSDNSSIDRHSPMKLNQPKNDYGIGFSASPTYQPQAFTVGSNPGYHGGPVGGTPMNYKGKKPVPSQNHGPPLPPVPQKDYSMMQRRPLPQQQPQQQQRPDMGEKRKSWFARRFSRAS